MSLYAVGQTVWATKEMVTPACGDHPAFLHCRAGTELYVIEVHSGKDHPYIVSDNRDGTYPFSCSGLELMGQKPFKENLPQPVPGGTGWGIWS